MSSSASLRASRASSLPHSLRCDLSRLRICGVRCVRGGVPLLVTRGRSGRRLRRPRRDFVSLLVARGGNERASSPSFSPPLVLASPPPLSTRMDAILIGFAGGEGYSPPGNSHNRIATPFFSFFLSSPRACVSSPVINTNAPLRRYSRSGIEEDVVAVCVVALVMRSSPRRPRRACAPRIKTILKRCVLERLPEVRACAPRIRNTPTAYGDSKRRLRRSRRELSA